MKVAYLGNFNVSFTTESHVAGSLEAMGHQVTRMQEGDVRAIAVPAVCQDHDMMLWTQTYGLAVTGGTIEERQWMLDTLKSYNVPTVGFHLDRWWGLEREAMVATEPFFRVDHLFTADGGHQAEWGELGINHYWSPPAVYHAETDKGKRNPMFVSNVAFVGSWRNYAHDWDHRGELVHHLQTRWRNDARLWPQQSAVRGRALQDLYASVKIVVGDSCLMRGATHYWSDRIPETVGRGAFLLHPYVDGIEDHYEDGTHLRLWQLGDWRELDRLITYYLEHDDERESIAREGHAHVKANHTYMNRMQNVIERVFGAESSD